MSTAGPRAAAGYTALTNTELSPEVRRERFLRLFDDHARTVLAYLRLAADPVDADALVLDTFSRAWEGWWAEVERPAADHEPWLLRLARATAADYRRHGLAGDRQPRGEPSDFEQTEAVQRLRRARRAGMEVLALGAAGLTPDQVAVALGLSPADCEVEAAAAVAAMSLSGSTARDDIQARLRRAAVRPGDEDRLELLREDIGERRLREAAGAYGRRKPLALAAVATALVLGLVLVVLRGDAGLVLGQLTGGSGVTGVDNMPVPAASHHPAVAVSPLALRHLSMFSATTGWAFASSVPGDAAVTISENAVVRTVDGGRNWTARLLRGGSAPSAFYALNADTAWALALAGDQNNSNRTRQVFRTDDGGTSWTPSSTFLLPTSIDPTATREELTFISPQYGWLLETSSAGPVTGTVIFRTIDGGTQWRQVGAFSTIADPAAATANPCRTVAFSFRTADVGFVAGECGARTLFQRTDDGGASYRPVSLVTPAGPVIPAGSAVVFYGLSAPIFATDLVGFMVGTRSVGPTTGGPGTEDQAVIYRTGDGGQSWTARTFPAAPLLSDLRDAGHLWFVAAPRGQGSDRGQLYTSVDGGATVRMGAGATPAPALQLQMISPQSGFILREGVGGAEATTLWTTADAGDTWTLVNSTLPTLVVGQ